MRVASESIVLNFTWIPRRPCRSISVAQLSIDAQQINSFSSITPDMCRPCPERPNFTDLVQLTPAQWSIPGYRTAVDGNRGVQNNLMIDGASFNSQFAEQRGTRFPSPSPGLHPRIAGDHQPYDCSNGNASGGIINAVTKTGTNELTEWWPLRSGPAPSSHGKTGSLRSYGSHTLLLNGSSPRRSTRATWGADHQGRSPLLVNVDYIHPHPERAGVSPSAMAVPRQPTRLHWSGGMGHVLRQ